MSGEAPPLLEGMRVLSFCHYLQGPAATQYLADMGADVIKIEPLDGAFERRWSGAKSFVDGVSAFFLCANRNKKSFAINLKHHGSRAVIERLVGSCDAVVENYRPGVMDKLGLGYEALRRIRPDIIYASATGFGSSGPMRDRPGQDLLVQARSGLAAATGTGVPVGCAAVDQHGAALLAMGVLGAYVRRLATGRGTQIEASLFNAGIDLQMEALTLYYSGKFDRRVLDRDSRLGTWFHEAPYGTYQLSDAAIILSLNPIPRLAEALDSANLRALAEVDPYQERDRVARAIAEDLAPRRYDEVAAAFDTHAIWYERLRDYDDLAADPQAANNHVFRMVPIGRGEATLINHPLRYDGGVPPLRGIPEQVGQHTEEILSGLGYSGEDIEELQREGVVRTLSATREREKT